MALLDAQDVLAARFGGLKAVVDFNFTLDRGELVGLIGPNGAGKTTVVQPAHRRLHARRRRRSACRQRRIAGLHAVPHQPRWHRAHVPEHPPLREPDRARQRARRLSTSAAAARSRRTRSSHTPARHNRARQRRSRLPRTLLRMLGLRARARQPGAQATSPTATSAASRSPARSPPSRRSSCSTSPPPA